MAAAVVGTAPGERSEQARVARTSRLAALIGDTLIFGVITFVVNSVFGVEQLTSYSSSPNSGFSISTSSTTVAWPVLTLVAVAYFVTFESVFGATPGKLLTRLKVVRVDGRPLTVGAVVARNLLKPVDWLPILYLLGGLFVLATRNSQRIGDLAAGTTVVYQHRAMQPGETLHASPRAKRILFVALAALTLLTLAFDYFGRPPLVIEGMFNTHRIFVRGTTSYTLGQPSWGFGTITYPVTTRGPSGAADCTGEITLQWEVLGWNAGSADFSCGV
jgi:uncharacterized RDD family membrane protein YckC